MSYNILLLIPSILIFTILSILPILIPVLMYHNKCENDCDHYLNIYIILGIVYLFFILSMITYLSNLYNILPYFFLPFITIYIVFITYSIVILIK